MKQLLKRQVIYGVIILFVIGVIYLLTPTIHYQAKGIYLPKHHAVSAITVDQVQLTDQLSNFSQNETQIGMISIEYQLNNNNLSEQAKQRVLTLAKQLAAQHGSDTVVVQAFMPASDPGGPGGTRLYFKALALKRGTV